MKSVKNILVPTDCSDLSTEALEFAIELTKQFGAELTLLKVFSFMLNFSFDDLGIPVPDLNEQVLSESEKRHVEELERFWNSYNHENIKAKLVCLMGDPFDEIIRYVNNNSIDLIVMGTHGYTGLKHIVLGSVTEKVTRYAPPPVLTVRHKDFKIQASA